MTEETRPESEEAEPVDAAIEAEDDARPDDQEPDEDYLDGEGEDDAGEEEGEAAAAADADGETGENGNVLSFPANATDHAQLMRMAEALLFAAAEPLDIDSLAARLPAGTTSARSSRTFRSCMRLGV